VTSGPLRAHAGASINSAYFRALRLSSLRWLAACSLLLWGHAYGTPLFGWVVWLAVLATSMCFTLACLCGAMERRWRLQTGPWEQAGIVVAVPRPDLDRLRSALLWVAAALALVPWATGLGGWMPWLMQQVGPLAAVVLGPAAALELLAATREALPRV
jgi:hypothetical protein